MELLKPILVLLHVLFAFAYVAGYRLLNAPGGALVGLTGIATALVFGYSLLSGWVLVSIALFTLIVATGIFYWARVGTTVDRAAAAGDDATVVRELRRPRNVAVSRIENLVLLTIIVLMVLRPS